MVGAEQSEAHTAVVPEVRTVWGSVGFGIITLHRVLCLHCDWRRSRVESRDNIGSHVLDHNPFSISHYIRRAMGDWPVWTLEHRLRRIIVPAGIRYRIKLAMTY